MTGTWSRFVLGGRSFFGGFTLIWRAPGLWKYAIVPFLLDALVVILGIYFGVSYLTTFIGAAVPLGGGFWASVLHYVALFFGVLVLVGLLLLLALVVANLVASPFHGLLAERTLIHLKAIPDTPFRFGTWIRTSLRMLRASLVKAICFVALGVVLFFGALLPGVQFAVAFIGLLMASFDCSDFSFEAIQLGLRPRFSFFFSHLPEYCGFGGALGLTFIIPGLNFILLPGAVVGAAILVAEIKKKEVQVSGIKG